MKRVDALMLDGLQLRCRQGADFQHAQRRISWRRVPAEKHMFIVFAGKACKGPNTQDQARHLMAWTDVWLVIQRPHSVFMTFLGRTRLCFDKPLEILLAFLRQRNNSVLFWPGDTREAELSRQSSASHGVPAMLRETREDLGRSPSTEKHKCIVLTMKDRVRTFETKPSVSWAHYIQDMTAPIIHQVLLKSSLANPQTALRKVESSP